MTVQQMIDGIQSQEEDARIEACLGAGKLGAPAIVPLAGAMAADRPEVSRAATRALWNVVHAAGAPGAPGKQDAAKELLKVLREDRPVQARRDILWMVSELCDTEDAAAPVLSLLANAELKEDARMVLERLPGDEAVAALKLGFARAGEEFKFNLAESLRKRGVPVPSYPSQRLLPTRAG